MERALCGRGRYRGFSAWRYEGCKEMEGGGTLKDISVTGQAQLATPGCRGAEIVCFYHMGKKKKKCLEKWLQLQKSTCAVRSLTNQILLKMPRAMRIQWNPLPNHLAEQTLVLCHGQSLFHLSDFLGEPILCQALC